MLEAHDRPRPADWLLAYEQHMRAPRLYTDPSFHKAVIAQASRVPVRDILKGRRK